MKKLTYKKGNVLTDETIQVVIHQTNTMGVMGSGVALSIKNMYPQAYEAYKLTEKENKLKLGEISYAGMQRNGKPFVIINVNGQGNFGVGVRQTNYEALFVGLERSRKICDLAQMEPKPTIGLPFNIGCARGGGDWRIVERLIEVAFDGYSGDVVVVDYDGVENK